MMLPVVLFCQVFGGAFGFDHVKIDEEALFVALGGDKEEGRAIIRSLGGYSPAAFPVYMKWLDREPIPLPGVILSRIFLMLQQANGDKSAFRTHAVAFAAHEHKGVSRNAILLLAQIGTKEDAAAVANQLKRRMNDVAYYDSIIATLSAIGTEKEIEAIEAERKAGLLKDYPRFWARVDECEKAIRERVAKKKDPKATPPDKK